jgi:hypothetical protein
MRQHLNPTFDAHFFDLELVLVWFGDWLKRLKKSLDGRFDTSFAPTLFLRKNKVPNKGRKQFIRTLIIGK